MIEFGLASLDQLMQSKQATIWYGINNRLILDGECKAGI
jgi:hypothetical protein